MSRAFIAWLHVAGASPSVRLIADMSTAGAYYNGLGWYRIDGDDLQARSVLEGYGLEGIPGKPPPELFRCAPTLAQLEHIERIA